MKPDPCPRCGQDRLGAMFECPSCGTDVENTTLKQRGLEMEVAQRLGEGESRESIIRLLVQSGKSRPDAIEMVRRLDTERQAAPDTYQSRTAEVHRQHLYHVAVGGLVILIVLVLALAGALNSRSMQFYVLLIGFVGLGDFAYGLYRLVKVRFLPE